MEFTKEGILDNGTLYTLKEISRKINEKIVEEDDLVIIKFRWDDFRKGIYEYKLVSKKDALFMKKQIIGKHLSFGELFGKHNEIERIFVESDIEIVYDFSEVVDFFILNPCKSKHNYSFWENFLDNAECGEYDFSDSEIDEICSI